MCVIMSIARETAEVFSENFPSYIIDFFCLFGHSIFQKHFCKYTKKIWDEGLYGDLSYPHPKKSYKVNFPRPYRRFIVNKNNIHLVSLMAKQPYINNFLPFFLRIFSSYFL